MKSLDQCPLYINNYIMDLVYTKKKDETLGLCILDFDILSVKLLEFLLRIREKVDFLIVGILDEGSFYFVPFNDKEKILKEIFFVDYILDFSIVYVDDIVDVIKPDYCFFSSDIYKKEVYNLILEKNKVE